MGKEWMTVKDVASWLDVDVRTIKRWLAAGRLPKIKISPGMVRIPRAAVVALAQPTDSHL